MSSVRTVLGRSHAPITSSISSTASHGARLSARFFKNIFTAAAFCAAALVALFFEIPAQAQSNQVWPEISTFVKLNDQMRFYFLATTVKEDRESAEGEFGPNFDFYLKPLRKRSKWGAFSLDESKIRLLMVRIG